VFVNDRVIIGLDEPTQMSELARNMGFDASHITSIVDKLDIPQGTLDLMILTILAR